MCFMDKARSEGGAGFVVGGFPCLANLGVRYRESLKGRILLGQKLFALPQRMSKRMASAMTTSVKMGRIRGAPFLMANPEPSRAPTTCPAIMAQAQSHRT